MRYLWHAVPPITVLIIMGLAVIGGLFIAAKSAPQSREECILEKMRYEPAEQVIVMSAMVICGKYPPYQG